PLAAVVALMGCRTWPDVDTGAVNVVPSVSIGTPTPVIYTLSLHDALPIYTKDQVYAQNEMLAYQQKESTARVASIMENTNLSKQQQVSEIMRQMLTQAQTAGQYFTNDQIKEMTRKVSAEVDLV